jgi:hypothetical protein
LYIDFDNDGGGSMNTLMTKATKNEVLKKTKAEKMRLKDLNTLEHEYTREKKI